jgi:hypothetical protein
MTYSTGVSIRDSIPNPRPAASANHKQMPLIFLRGTLNQLATEASGPIPLRIWPLKKAKKAKEKASHLPNHTL